MAHVAKKWHISLQHNLGTNGTTHVIRGYVSTSFRKGLDNWSCWFLQHICQEHFFPLYVDRDVALCAVGTPCAFPSLPPISGIEKLETNHLFPNQAGQAFLTRSKFSLLSGFHFESNNLVASDGSSKSSSTRTDGVQERHPLDGWKLMMKLALLLVSLAQAVLEG